MRPQRWMLHFLVYAAIAWCYVQWVWVPKLEADPDWPIIQIFVKAHYIELLLVAAMLFWGPYTLIRCLYAEAFGGSGVTARRLGASRTKELGFTDVRAEKKHRAGPVTTKK